MTQLNEPDGNTSLTIKPNPWKWMLGAAASAAFMYFSLNIWGWGFQAITFAVCILVCILQASGVFTFIRFDSEGFDVRNFMIQKRYRWENVEGFHLQVMRINYFLKIKNIIFTRGDKASSAYGKFSKAFAGGTETMPALGDPGKLLELLHSMRSQATTNR